MQTIEKQVLARIKRGVTRQVRRKRTRHPISLVALAHYFPSWPRLRKALVQLETEDKIVVGLALLPDRGMYVHVFLAHEIPDTVRVVSLKNRTVRGSRMEHVNQKPKRHSTNSPRGLTKKETIGDLKVRGF